MPLGCALGEHRGFHVNESLRVHVPTHAGRSPVPQEDVLLQTRPAEIEVSVLEPQRVIDLDTVFDNERGSGGFVEDRHLMGDNLHVTGEHARIAHLFGAHGEQPGHCDAVLGPQRVGHGMCLRLVFRVAHDLGDPGAVAYVDENEAAEVPPALHPAEQGHRGVLRDMVDLAAVVGPLQIVHAARHARSPLLSARIAVISSTTAALLTLTWVAIFMSRTVRVAAFTSSSPRMAHRG